MNYTKNITKRTTRHWPLPDDPYISVTIQGTLSVVSSDTKLRRSMMAMASHYRILNAELVSERTTSRPCFKANIFIIRKYQFNKLDLQLSAYTQSIWSCYVAANERDPRSLGVLSDWGERMLITK